MSCLRTLSNLLLSIQELAHYLAVFLKALFYPRAALIARVLAQPLADTGFPKEFALSVYPNPFNPTTQIHFALPEEGLVSLRIYDLNGRMVKEWSTERRAAGEHLILWDGRDQSGKLVASGIYFSELHLGTTRKVTRMALIR